MIESPESSLLLLLASLLLFLMWSRALGFYPLVAQESNPEAEARANSLLRELLSESERQQMVRHGYLSVPSPGMPGRTYMVPARPGWVEVYESGVLAMKLCVEPVQRLPAADVVLMHKLMIEGNERKYLNEANVISVRNQYVRRPPQKL